MMMIEPIYLLKSIADIGRDLAPSLGGRKTISRTKLFQ